MFGSVGMATPLLDTPSRGYGAPSSRAKVVDPLWDALKRASVEKVQEALRKEPEAARIPFFDHRWEPPLCAAVRFSCSSNIIKQLLDHRSDPNMCDAEGRSPLVILYQQTQKIDIPSWPFPCYSANSMDQVTPMLFSVAERPQLSLGSQPLFPRVAQWPCFAESDSSQVGKDVAKSCTASLSTICQAREAETLKTAGLLLKNAAGPQNLKSVMQRIATCQHGKSKVTEMKLNQLLEDWSDATAFGLLLCAIRRDGDFSNKLSNALTEHWELVLKYVICHDIFNAAGLRFVRA